MMKYRIVSRNNGYKGFDYYYAQMKVFGVWVDCRYNPFITDTYDSQDSRLEVVEGWVEGVIRSSRPTKEQVIKTYEEDSPST